MDGIDNHSEPKVASETAEQRVKQWEKNLKPWQFKPGQSGNPSGRPKGSISLKEYAKRYLQEMTEEEKLEFMAGINKDKIWEMAEGKPKQDVEHGGVVTISHILDALEGTTNDRSAAARQIVENQLSVQNQEQGTETGNVQTEQSPAALQPEQVVQEHNPEIAPTGVHN